MRNEGEQQRSFLEQRITTHEQQSSSSAEYPLTDTQKQHPSQSHAATSIYASSETPSSDPYQFYHSAAISKVAIMQPFCMMGRYTNTRIPDQSFRTTGRRTLLRIKIQHPQVRSVKIRADSRIISRSFCTTYKQQKSYPRSISNFKSMPVHEGV